MNLLESRTTKSLTVFAALALVGCASSTPPSYPTSPPTPALAAPAVAPAAVGDTSTAVIKVPADAVELSHGDYPPPGFPAPNQPGLIMVVDLDGDPTTAVASTAVTGMDAGKQMSITDVANMSVTMNKLHKYRIVFVPTKPKM